MDEPRLKAFENMLAAVIRDHEQTVSKMAQLKAAGKEKSATYRQLMAAKLQSQNLLSMYRLYGLLDAPSTPEEKVDAE